MDVEPRKYRFRLLNTGISRTFKLYMELESRTGTKLPFKVIGLDSGQLEKSIDTSDLYCQPGTSVHMVHCELRLT
jgi:bilirubin oxidase